MVSIAQVQQGVVRFVDAEIVPRLSVTERLVVGGGMGLVAAWDWWRQSCRCC